MKQIKFILLILSSLFLLVACPEDTNTTTEPETKSKLNNGQCNSQ